MKKNIIVGLITLGVALLLYYFMLPPLNLSSPDFYKYLFIIVIFFTFIAFADQINTMVKWKKVNFYNPLIWVFASVIGIGVLIFVVNFVLSPLFNARSYSKRISVDETHEFITDVKEADFSKLPLIDKASSQKLGDRKMGEFTSWVSQFYVSDLYTQINYNNEIIRVTPLEYVDLFKYFTNAKEGIKGYIKVDSIDGSAELQQLDKGMKYMPSAYFFDNLNRKLRLSYPTTIFDTPNFEIDNDGNPYWIVPTIKYTGVGLKKEINGAIILDPITGESKKYAIKDIPTWVDHVYSAELIIEQVDNWGEYRNGYLNSIFGQKDVINTTDGYNYLVMDDDVYLYTGITSVSSDESNLGFILVNLRTKEAHYYLAPGAEEYSAMASAEGLVQEKKYDASFPLLINLNNKPTYILSLKDAAGLVKMYALIDVEDYQKVVVSDVNLGVEALVKKYLNENATVDTNNLKEKDITIKTITNAVIDGNTTYYITDTLDNYYMANISIAKTILPFLKKDDIITINYSEDKVSTITAITQK